MVFWAGAGCDGTPGSPEPLLDDLPVLTATEELRVGSVDDPDYGFSRVYGTEVDGDGNLFVGEPMAGEIRVYDSQGTLLRKIGRRGEGPGEFQQNFRWGVLGDTVWVTDFSLRRITLFDRGGALLSTGPWEGVTVLNGTSGNAGSVGPFAMRIDGLFWSEITTIALTMGAPPDQDSLRVPEVLFDASGAVIDTVGWDAYPPGGSPSERVEVGSRRYTVPRPPSGNVPRLEFPAGKWGVEREAAQGPSVSSFRVWRLGLQGDTVFSREYRYLPKPYSDAALDSTAMRMVQAVRLPEGADPDLVRQRLRDAMDFPDFQPPVLEGIAGADGSLWLRREDLGDAMVRWLVIRPDGTPMGHVEVPRQHMVSSVGESGFVAVERDVFDVPWVVRYRIEG